MLLPQMMYTKDILFQKVRDCRHGYRSTSSILHDYAGTTVVPNVWYVDIQYLIGMGRQTRLIPISGH